MDEQRMRQVAWIGDAYMGGPIRGVVLSFHGLGELGVKKEPGTVELGMARAGGLVVYPFYGPWAWMNRLARAFVDEVVEAVYRHFGLDDSVPLISTGASMGGQASLLYTRYAGRAVKACYALYPVCDLKYHFSERPDLPTSILYAFRGYEEDLDTLLAEHSPLAQVAHMPDIPYLLAHGDKDGAVFKAHHSDRMVAAMRDRGLRVEYVEVPGLGHGSPMPIEVLAGQIEFVAEHLA